MTAAYGKWQWGKGTYSASIDLAGALAPAFTFSATFANPNPLRGDLPFAVTVSDASLTALEPLSGDLAPQIVLRGILGSDLTLAGDLPFTLAFGPSSMHAGPLWSPDEPCAPVDWKETELCNG